MSEKIIAMVIVLAILLFVYMVHHFQPRRYWDVIKQMEWMFCGTVTAAFVTLEAMHLYEVFLNDRKYEWFHVLIGVLVLGGLFYASARILFFFADKIVQWRITYAREGKSVTALTRSDSKRERDYK